MSNTRSHKEKADAVGKLGELAEIASNSATQTIERMLEAAREQLGMEVAFVSEFVQGEQV